MDTAPNLVVYARCPRCQTWTFVADHSDVECRHWIALRSDPSHEHRWHLISATAASCLDCRTLGEVQTRPIPPGGDHD